MLKPITIPSEIHALNIATLPEKLLLAIYASDPTAKWVRRALSMTRAGLRKLERRLIQKGLLKVEGANHLIRAPGLVNNQQPNGGHFFSESATKQNGNKVANRGSKPITTNPVPLVLPAELLS